MKRWLRFMLLRIDRSRVLGGFVFSPILLLADRAIRPHLSTPAKFILTRITGGHYADASTSDRADSRSQECQEPNMGGHCPSGRAAQSLGHRRLVGAGNYVERR